jgi:hypothetical protein
MRLGGYIVPNPILDLYRTEEILQRVKSYIDDLYQSGGGGNNIGGGGNGYSNTWDGTLVPINGGGTGANNPAHAFANLFHYTVNISPNGGTNSNLDCVALGKNSLSQNIDGLRNVAIGTDSQRLNTTGDSNVSMGYRSLVNNSSGCRNIAIGENALASNNSGEDNTVVGYQAMMNNTNGKGNVAVGGHSLANNTEGIYNTAIGYEALKCTTSGSWNFVMGWQAFMQNTTGSGNVGVGEKSGQLNTSGNYNTYVGCRAGMNSELVDCNTAIGWKALEQNKTFDHVVGIGSNAQVTGRAQIQLGETGTNVYAYSALQNRSDRRDKANIKDIEYPYRQFIMGIRPVTFQWDLREDYRPDNGEHIPLDKITHNGTKIRSRRHSGVIAQEVKELMDRLGFDWSGYQDHKFNGGDDALSVAYEAFIPPMIKVIQDHDREMAEAQTQIAELREQVAELRTLIKNII